jgi:hypothetical protein
MEDICRDCHDQIHRKQEPWLWRTELQSGELIYVAAPNRQAAVAAQAAVEQLPDRDALDFLMGKTWPQELWDAPDRPKYWRVARLRSSCDEAIHEATKLWMDEKDVAIKIMKVGGARLARAFFELERLGDGWKLHGFDTKAMFATEIGYSLRTVNAYIAAERVLFENPSITEDQREALRECSMELRVGSSGAMADLNKRQVQEVIDRAQSGAPAQHVIEYTRTMQGKNRALADGFKYADVTLIVNAATLKIEVPYRDGEDPVIKAKKAIGARPYVHVIDWADDKQQRWEEVKDEG